MSIWAMAQLVAALLTSVVAVRAKRSFHAILLLLYAVVSAWIWQASNPEILFYLVHVCAALAIWVIADSRTLHLIGCAFAVLAFVDVCVINGAVPLQPFYAHVKGTVSFFIMATIIWESKDGLGTPCRVRA